MSGVWTTSRIRQEIDRLAEWRGRLIDGLTDGARELDAHGLVPDDALLMDLTDYRQRMRTVAGKMTGRNPSVQDRLSLPLFESLLQTSRQCEDRVRELSAIEDLEHVDDPDYAPLIQCREDLHRCQTRLTRPLDPHDFEQTQLFQQEHPLQAVLRLTDPAPEMSDDEWNRLQDQVVTAYGRTFAAALVRGKIRRRPKAETVVSPSEPMPSPDRDDVPSIHALAGSHIRASVALKVEEPASSFNVMEDEGEHSQRWFQPGSSILPGVTKSASAIADEPGESAVALTEMPNVEPEVVIDLDLPKPVRHTDAAAQLAREIAAENPQTAVRLNALVRQLVRDDRLALAAHLAQCSERLPSGRNMLPPAGLLRALALGKSLSYSRGELARAVELEFKRLAATPFLPSVKDDDRLATEFLLRAAALLPALLGASPSASTVLRSFAIEPGLSHLYNYCHRVAQFGERLQSQAVELFQAPAEQTQWLAERKQLQSEVRVWLDQFVKRGVQYQRSSPLFLHAHWTVMASPAQRSPQTVTQWAKWQEVLLCGHRLLKPIAEGSSQRNDLRRELSRAAALLQTENSESLVPRSANGREAVPLSAAMQSVLLEAVDLANRWLRLESATPARGLQLAPQQAEELRTELLERAGGVLAELDVVARSRSNTFVQTGVACCRRVVESIRQLCAGEVPLALHEPDARQVLNGEFLKIPHVELDENWQPMGEATEQEQAILAHVCTGWTDWNSAFALQCQQEDHLATSRLLEMPVWSDPATLRALHRVRGEELQRARQAVLREIDGLASQVALDRAGEERLDAARDEVQRRLERLRIAVPQVLSLAPLRHRLERSREHWRRLVVGETITLEDSGVLLANTPAVNPPSTESASTEANWVFLEE